MVARRSEKAYNEGVLIHASMWKIQRKASAHPSCAGAFVLWEIAKGGREGI